MELLQVFREITMLKNRSSMHSSLKLTHTSPTVTASRCLSLRSELTCTKFGASGGRKTVKDLTACEKCGLDTSRSASVARQASATKTAYLGAGCRSLEMRIAPLEPSNARVASAGMAHRPLRHRTVRDTPRSADERAFVQRVWPHLCPHMDSSPIDPRTERLAGLRRSGVVGRPPWSGQVELNIESQRLRVSYFSFHPSVSSDHASSV